MASDFLRHGIHTDLNLRTVFRNCIFLEHYVVWIKLDCCTSRIKSCYFKRDKHMYNGTQFHVLIKLFHKFRFTCRESPDFLFRISLKIRDVWVVAL